MAADQRFKVIFISMAIAMLPITADADTKEQPSLTIAEARKYVLNLINSDRKANGQKPVELDAVATIAGQQHSNDMAENGYLSHWDMAGTKPDERYTRAGGEDNVAENGYILSFTDSPQHQTLSSTQLFSKSELADAQQAFMNEVPPDDGHRKNILDPHHTSVGIGISISGDEHDRRLALTQEFVDNYGSFSPLPKSIKAGDKFVVAGKLAPGINIYSMDVRWEKLPTPMTLAQLKETYSYAAPEDRIATYWPERGHRSGINIAQTESGMEFSNNVYADPALWKPGLYYVFVWGLRPGDQRPFVVSRRTVELR
ncbi:MAG: CAP domain-containing protein [Candidatus Obscuribacterales bacterium]|nr:CAP domain-containing protein [Candidatus Obscuribacterales bacterium]